LDTLQTSHSELHISFPNLQLKSKGLNYLVQSTELYLYFDGSAGLKSIFDG
jgi:hypothetical protein